MNILIAEDNFTSRSLLQAVLQKQGHTVLPTERGLEAWEALRRPDAPRMAILDWMMPDMDGLEVVRRIRGLPTDQPPYIIMLTTKGEKADVIAGLDAGANDYLTKPFDAKELRARIEVGVRVVELQAALGDQVKELQQALEEVRTLRGIIPICATCKKIRDDRGFWQRVEAYVGAHTEAVFTHGLCPECLVKAEAEIDRDSATGLYKAEAGDVLRASELRYRRLFESAKDGILILDAETGMVVDVNPFLIQLLGFSREAFLGKEIWELGFFKDIVANQDNFAELQQQEYIRYEDKPLETADGRRIDVEFVSNVYLVNHQKVIQCNIRDITERKRVEEGPSRTSWPT
jgi:phosphoserine phosphatase RsbU/P